MGVVASAGRVRRSARTTASAVNRIAWGKTVATMDAERLVVFAPTARAKPDFAVARTTMTAMMCPSATRGLVIQPMDGSTALLL